MFKKMMTLSLLISTSLAYTGVHALDCPTIKHIEGVYQCRGECVITSDSNQQSVIQVSGEQDTIERYPGAKHLYRITIEGSGGFKEVEIGALYHNKLYTATSQVSDGQYPVLENYLFETTKHCKATSYTKIVRNPTHGQFKACHIVCTKGPH